MKIKKSQLIAELERMPALLDEIANCPRFLCRSRAASLAEQCRRRLKKLTGSTLLAATMALMATVISSCAAPVQFTFTTSACDTNPADGGYYLCAQPTNAPDPSLVLPIASAPSGGTNFLIDSTQLPASQVFLYCAFSNSVGWSKSTPLYFDYAAWSKSGPPTPPGPPKPGPNPHK